MTRDQAWDAINTHDDERKYVEQLKDDLEDALQQLRDASPIGSRNLRASLARTQKERDMLAEQLEKAKSNLQSNGAVIGGYQKEIEKLKKNLVTEKNISTNQQAELKTLHNLYAQLSHENQSLKAAAGINDFLVIKRSL